MTHCVGYLLTHWFGSRTQLDVCGQYSDHCSTYTFSHVGLLYTHTHADIDMRLCEKEWQRGKIKRNKSVMLLLNVHDDWSVWNSIEGFSHSLQRAGHS